MRFRLAADRRLLTDLLRVFLQTLLAWQRRRGRELGIMGGQTGAVTFLQRFGSAMNLNPHLHAVVPDGLFVPERVAAETIPGAGCSGAFGMAGTRLRFVALPPPTTADVEALTVTLAQRLTDRLTADAEERSEYLARIIHESERQEGPRVLEKQCLSGFSHERRPSDAHSDYDAVCSVSRSF
jgi:hypothetical protein